MRRKRKWLMVLGACIHAGALVVAMARATRLKGGGVPAPETNAEEKPEPATVTMEPPVEEEKQETGERTLSRFTVVLLWIGGLLVAVSMLDLALRGPRQFPADRVWSLPGGDAAAGRQAILQHGCGACHVIPGIRNATGRVGPQLVDFSIQTFVGGVLPNTPENLVRWIQNPREVNPLTAMPNLGVTEEEARHIASYLYSATGR